MMAWNTMIVRFSLLLLSLFIVSESIFNPEDESDRSRGRKFVESRLKSFISKARQNKPLNGFYEDLIKYFEKAKASNNHLLKLVGDRISMNDIKNINELNAYLETFESESAMRTNYFEYAIMWIEMRMHFIRNDKDINVLFEIRDDLQTIEDAFNAMREVIVVKAKKLKTLHEANLIVEKTKIVINGAIIGQSAIIQNTNKMIKLKEEIMDKLNKSLL